MNTIDNQQIKDKFMELSTPLIADAMVRLGIKVRMGEPGIQSLTNGTRLAGRIIPVRHYGSVDVFFEAMTSAQVGDILVIDNQGRKNEGCIGDLTALEAQAFGIAGIIVWGCHRDTSELKEIGFPVFTYGRCPVGPLRVNEREVEALSSALFCKTEVKIGDVVFADDDGVIFASEDEIEKLLKIAKEIRETERRQAQEIIGGNTLHQQLQFDKYLIKRKTDTAYTFRKYLRDIGGAIEE